jgi:hypothetical protein
VSAEAPNPARPAGATGATEAAEAAGAADAARADAPAAGSRTGAAVLRSVGIGLVLLLLLAGAASVVAQFFSQRTDDTTTITEPVTRVIVRTDTGDVRVRQASAGTPVQVHRTLHWSFHQPRTSAEAGNGLLTVAGSCQDSWWFAQCDTDFEILLPPGVALDLTTNTGDIRASASAAVAARTDTGDILVTAPGAPTVDARTNTGDVVVTGGSAGASVRAQSDIGAISLTLAESPALARALTNTGDITVTVPGGAGYHVVATSDTGDTRVDVPEDRASPRTVEASTDTGDVVVRAG